MKQNINLISQFVNGFKIATLSLGFMITGYVSHAQTINPPSNTDIFLATAKESNVNCDMLWTGSTGGNLKAIVFDDVSTGGTTVMVSNDAGGSFTINIPSGIQPDVALANEIQSGIDVYTLAVIYQDNISSSIIMNTYDITGATTSSLAYTGPTNQFISSGIGFGVAPFPHIDMFADPGTTMNGLPTMHDFVIEWGEGNGFSSDIYVQHGNINDLTTWSGPYLISSNCSSGEADVSASLDVSSGTQHGYLAVLDDDPAGVILTHYDFDCSSNTIASTTTMVTSGYYYPPRIESMGMFSANISSTNSPWTIVFPHDKMIYMHNTQNLAGYLCTPYPTLKDNYAGTVAAGIGDPYQTDYCDENYPIGWLDNANNRYLTQDVDYASSMMVSPTNYYQVSNNLQTTFTAKIGLAMSSTSNWGKGLLTAWYSNFAVYYKFTSDIQSYKPTAPTGISNVSISNQYTIYPNPATKEVTLTSNDNSKMNAIAVYNTVGENVYNAKTTGSKIKIDISGFSSGMYNILIATDKGNVSQKLIVK